MEYFIMRTDSRLRRLPQFQRMKELIHIDDERYMNGKKSVPVIYVKENTGFSIEYPDYIAGPVPMIAEKFHKILVKYQQDTIFNQVVLTEKESGVQKVYYMMLPPVIECAEKGKTTYDMGGNVKDFVLDAGAVGKNRIFSIKELRNQIAVRLDVAESILRRDANGIWFEPLKQ